MDPEELKKRWLLQNEKICICKGIPRRRIIEVIEEGATTLGEINRYAGSGRGECKGRRCGPKIKSLLADCQPHAPKNVKKRNNQR